MFDPWTASFEEANAEQAKWREAGGDWSSPNGPLFQADGARRILALKKEIDDGDGFSVLAAIRIIVTNGLVAPIWLAYAFNRRYDSVLNCRAGSWDDQQAFGSPYPKGTNLAARRKARLGRLQVWNAVDDLLKRHPDTPIDKGLFETVGKPLGFGVPLTERYYYEAKKMCGCVGKAGHSVNPAKIKKTAGLRKRRQ